MLGGMDGIGDASCCESGGLTPTDRSMVPQTVRQGPEKGERKGEKRGGEGKGGRFGPSTLSGHPAPANCLAAAQRLSFVMQGGGRDKTNNDEIGTGRCRTESLAQNEPKQLFLSFQPQPSSSSFLTSRLFSQTGVPPLDQRSLASKVISVNPPFSAISH